MFGLEGDFLLTLHSGPNTSQKNEHLQCQIHCRILIMVGLVTVTSLSQYWHTIVCHFLGCIAAECSEVFKQHEIKTQQLIFVFKYLYF